MKKLKLIILILVIVALGVTAYMLLFRPSKTLDTIEISDIINEDATYKSKKPLFTNMEMLSSLEGTTCSNYNGDLFYFTETVRKYKEHTIYNAKTNRIVETLADNETTTYTVNLGSNYATETSYYTVNIHVWTLNADGKKAENSDVYTTVLYNSSGTRIASAEYTATATSVADLVCFDNKCYSPKSNFSLAFSASPLGKVPSVQKRGDYYYSGSEACAIIVYDSQFNFVSRYNYPSYAQNVQWDALNSGDIFLQYSYTLDDNNDDYTYLKETDGVLTKYKTETFIIDYEDGSADKIKCNFLVSDIDTGTDEEIAESGLNEKFTTLVYATLIENNRLSTNFYGMVDDDGSVYMIEGINGGFARDVNMVANNRWVVSTDTGKYLINNKGEVIGDISKATVRGSYMYVSSDSGSPTGKIYDLDLNPIFDITANELTYVSSVGDSIIFKNTDGDYVLYNGGSSTVTVASGAAILKGTQTWLGTISNCIVIRNASNSSDVKYLILNSNGSLIKTISANELFSYSSSSLPFNYVTSSTKNGYAIVSTTLSNGDYAFYRISV